MSSDFYNFTPDLALNSIENLGFDLTGRYTQMNSYENRVFDFELEDEKNEKKKNEKSIIAKFYRPNRWSIEAIKEEHEFLEELKSQGIPAVAPIKLGESDTTFMTQNMISTLFPKAQGRLMQEFLPTDLKSIGGLLARIHNIGAQKKSRHRPILNEVNYGEANLEIIRKWISPELQQRYESACYEIIDYLAEYLDESDFIRIHGDCHRGNILQTDPVDRPKEFFFIDFDDFCMGHPVQDFWMLFSEEDSSKEEDLILSGYTELREFNEDSLHLIKGLRGLRIINYAAWIAKRWKDPSFKKIFPNFREYIYWAEETEALEKIAWSL